MNRRRWLSILFYAHLPTGKGRTVLLLAVLAMASSLATALGIVSSSMEKRVAEEVRKYGANLIIIPESARLDVGSGGLNFGVIAEPAYLQQRQVEDALARSGLKAERSFHLRGALHWKDADIMVEGVNFADIRRLFPWWQLKGSWPAAGETVVGNDLATRLKLKPGIPWNLPGRLKQCGCASQALFLPAARKTACCSWRCRNSSRHSVWMVNSPWCDSW